MTVEEIEEKILECEHNVFKEIQELNDRVEAQEVNAKEADLKRMKMSEKLDEIALQSKVNFELISQHTSEQNAKYDEIIGQLKDFATSINKLAEATNKNTGYIMSYEEDARVDRLVADKLKVEKEAQDLLDAPRKAIKNKIILTAVGLVTTVLVGGILSVLWFGFKAYMKLQLGE